MRMAIYIAIAIPLFLLGGAYISQYGFGLYPCEMCWWQRYPHFIALFCGLFALFVPKFAKMLTILAALSLMISGLIGGFHAGVEYAWWKGVSACAVTISSDGDFLEALMNAPLIRCDVAPWSLFGVSLAGYNFIFSASAAIIIITKIFKK